jgi:RNA polymerase sigma factor (sigma-70 family)
MQTIKGEGSRPHLEADAAGARKRAAVETYARNEAALRRTARRYSICADDADDALQRGLEILLRKAPTDDPRELIKWTQTVVKHEALAVRRERERILAGPAAATPEPDAADWVSLLPAESATPEERVERREEIARSREALRALKPQELRALGLLAEGYSYAEIGEITGYSRTKVNRCLAEGRERFRKLVAQSEDGSRCAELRPILSAFCDGEASAEEAEALREHLRACAPCRAAVRAYRAAPEAAAALAPTLPLHRSLLERAHDAIGNLIGRFGGEGTASGIAAGGGGGASLAKLAAICAATAGGAAACVAGGVVPAPAGVTPERAVTPNVVPGAEPQGAPRHEPLEVEHWPAPVPPQPDPPHAPAKESAEAPAPAEPAPAPAESAEPVEYAPPAVPEPAPATASVGAGDGSPAGEFGP